MSQLVSTSLCTQDQLRMDQIISLNQLAKNYKGKVYFLAGKRSIVDVSKFPSLITFFLITSGSKQIKVLIDGDNPSEILKEMDTICSTESRFSSNFLNTAEKVKV
ncbi:hypothetical protein LIT32_04750 [Bacillus sp. CMF21]|uniref:hypothetical protein n=1 Tax=Metabacillus dongyingensis TaxID=2874282 RepID=UPI001CC035B0|nr:hypothetical protein [Metabacillus dongyingensis]UAL53110.1 hypothetical protein K8L98_04720 [Metabacillus dongyingensis]UOK58671.1 hypothetical protein MGI18_05875 [Bacillus sp. OVS6]USK29435.1 hypothetical protein LIT32_04750 [Bacillus sp. CMF21]